MEGQTAFCVVGSYSVDGSLFDVGAMLGFGILGYLLKKLDYPLAPFVLTLILGPMMEKALRQSLEYSAGELSVFVTRPISATLLVIATLFILSSALQVASKVRGGDTQI